MAQSPGGVSGASRWYRADTGVTTGATMTWADQSGNNVNVTQATATNQPVYNSGTNLMNFNPKVTFDGGNDRLSNATGGVSFGTGAYTVYYVASNTATATTPRWAFGFGASDALGSFNSGLNTAVTSKASGGTTFVTQTNQWTSGVPSLTRTGYNGGVTQPYYLSSNGVAETTSTNVSPNITTTPFSIGARPDGLANWWQGDISEVIIYPGKHSSTDFNKVESYLSLKYGIAKSGDYIASNGTTTYWTAASNTGYTNNIAGIGRDDISGLHQRQSQSQNTGVQPVIGNNSTIIATNTSGAGDFATDNNFMLWGSDTGSDKIETAFAFGSMNARMGKIWKIQETNAVGTIKVALRKSDFHGTNQHLLVSNDNAFDGSDIMIAMIEETIGGVVYYTATVDFINGQFFSFASYVVTPGGVITDISAWFKADSSVYSNAGTTLATNGTTVQQWDDHSGSGYNLSQATAGDRPVYYSTTANKLVNFNPSIEYVSTDRLVNANRLMPVSSAHSFFGVAIDQATATGYKMIFSCDNSDDQFELYKQAGSTNTNGWMSRRSGNDYRLVNGLNNNNVIGGNGFSASGGSNGFWNGTNYSENLGVQPQVFGLLGNGTAAGSGVSFVDGYKATNTSSVGTPANWFGRFSVGARTGGGNPFIGRIPEIIAYNRQLTDTEAQKINSYLAIKYGTTLGQGGVNIVNNNGNNYNYLNSDGNIVWNASANSTYKYHIAGIGRDDASALNQTQSQSQNATETNQVIFGLGTVAATNAANGNTFTFDKQFLLWGDNGASGPVAFSDTADATIFSRLARTWFVDNSNSYAQDTQLLIPVALTTGGTSPKLVMNTSSAFTSGTNTYIPLSTTTTINSVNYYVVNLTAAQVATDFYFTVATNQKAPGGVATGLQLWMKANDGWSATNWIDRSSNGFIATRVGTPTQTKRVNFHPTVSFTPGNYYNIPHNTLLNQNAQNQITVAAVFTTTPRTYNSFMAKTVNANWDNGWQLATEDNTSTNRLGFNTGDWSGGAPGYAAFQNIPILNPAIAFGYSTGNTGFANFISISGKVATQSTANVNTQISTSDLRIGDAGGYGYEGDLSEALMYNQNNASEKARIDSYLAIKYGITLDQTTPNNYVNSSGTIIWDATSNSGFKNDIAGIVRDDFSTLNQVMSKSVNSNAEPILSLSTIPVTNLNDTHAATNIFENNNQSLVWGNNAVRGFTSFTDPIDTNIIHRLSRVWKAQTTNYDITGNDDIVFNFTKGSLQSFINSGSNYYLILSTTPDFSSNNYFVQLPTSFSNIDGTDYISSIYDVSSNAFSGITSNGAFYFTVAGKGTGPGGVLGIFWNRADKDVVTSGSNVSKWTDQMFGIESTQVRANTNVPTLGANINLFNFNPYLDFTNTNQSLGNEFVAPTEGFNGHIEQFFVTKDNAYSGRLFGINYDLKLSASGGNKYDWNAFESAFYRSRAASPSGATATTNFSPALSTTLQNLSHLVSTASSNLFSYRYNGSTIASTTNASYNYIGQGGFVYGANNQGSIGGDDAGVTAQLAEHLIVGEALTATERRQVESYLAVKYGITISDLTSDASYRDASGNATFTTDATFRHDIFGIAKDAAAGIDQRISRSINNDAGNATNIITVSTDTNFTNLNATHADALSDAQYLIFASNNGAVAFTGGSAITASDGTVFSATEVLATRWKAQDKGGVGCVNMRFNNAAFTAVTGPTKYYMIVADDAAFTQNVTYREVTRDASSNIDVTVNFGDNTNSSAATGNYFTIARKNLSITPANLATVYTGVNTIGTSPNWKPTQPNTYLEINSNEKGVIVTRVADVTVATIASPIEGMMVFDLSDNKFKVYTGTSWRTLGLSEGVSATFCN